MDNQKLNQIKNLVTIYSVYIFNIWKFFLFNFFASIKSFITGEKLINNDVVLITGSGGYLGRNLAFEFAKRNATLVLWDINEDQNKKTLKELNSKGYSNAYIYTIDITNQEKIKSTAQKVRDQVGDVTLVIMAAAPTFKPKSILEVNYTDDIEKHFKIGYMAQLWLIQEFLKPMIKKNHGHFVTISSNSALADVPLISSYASFKLAQTKLLETLREELACNEISGVKTTVVYLSILRGGLADGFQDSFEFSDDVYVTGPYAAEKVVRGVLKNKEVIYVPKIQWVFALFKHLISGRFLGFIVSKKAKINPKYLKLKIKSD